MKGIALEYIFIVILVVIVIFVGAGIVSNIIRPGIIPRPTQTIDVKYACVQYNESKISFENLKILLYGFLTDQCKYFVGELKENVTVEDLRRVVKEIDETVNVVVLYRCELPTFAANTLYFCCGNVLEKGKIFNITRKEIKFSDVLICQ